MEYSVSICSTTYNLEKYIAQAIESWLAQKTTFPVEIVISDDGSTDSTRAIVEKYAQSHDNIRLVCNNHMGMMPNFIKSLQEAKGKYIAVCDGDDYWTDPYKLQKQFDFMENHPDFSACFTNSLIIEEATGEEKIAKTKIWDTATTAELLEHKDNDNIEMSPGHTSTYFYRNNLLVDFPDWMYGNVMTDFPLYMLVSRYGKAKFINEVTSVYRSRLCSDSTKDFTLLKAYRQRIYAYENVNKELGYEFKGIINPIVSDYYFRIGKLLAKTHKPFSAVPNFVRSVFTDSSIIKGWFKNKTKSK